MTCLFNYYKSKKNSFIFKLSGAIISVITEKAYIGSIYIFILFYKNKAGKKIALIFSFSTNKTKKISLYYIILYFNLGKK